MMTQKKYKFDVDVSSIRLDVFLANKLPDFSRTSIQHSIKSNLVTINNKLAKRSAKINVGDVIECIMKAKEINDEIIPQEIPLNILFEDDDIIVINKPAGIVVHPGNGNRDGTLVNGLAYHCNKLSTVNELRPGIVHRLDKNTSGVIVIAKTNHAHVKIANQFLNKKVKKTYYALAWGKINNEGIIEGFITRDKFNRTKFKISDQAGKLSKTKYFLENYFEPISFVKLEPKTGRTHQIRVHLNSIGHPIFSDNEYSGGRKRMKSYHVKYTNILKQLFKGMNRMALHAERIEFIHPDNDKPVSFSAPFPEDFNKALRLLENQ